MVLIFVAEYASERGFGHGNVSVGLSRGAVQIDGPHYGLDFAHCGLLWAFI